MAEDSRKEVAYRALAVFARAVFKDYFYLTLLAIGLLFALLPIFFPDRQDTALFRALAHVGDAILTGGAVITFMRFFASLDLIGEKIDAWLTNEKYLTILTKRLTLAVHDPAKSEMYLKDLTTKLSLAVYDPGKIAQLGDLTTIWRNVTLAMTRDRFPEIADKVYKKALEKLTTEATDYYLDSYQRVTHIRALKDDPNFCEVEHELRLTLIASQHNTSARFQTRISMDQFSDGKPVVRYFQVDGKPQSLEPSSAEGDRPGVKQFVLEAPLPGGAAVNVAYAYRFKQSLTRDPFMIWTTTRYVRQAHHEINFPHDTVECTYQDTMFESLLQPDPACSEGRLVYVSRRGELIFPGSAFIVMFRTKSWHHDPEH